MSIYALKLKSKLKDLIDLKVSFILFNALDNLNNNKYLIHSCVVWRITDSFRFCHKEGN